MSKIRFRTEKDSLGPVEIPFEALYGAQTARAKCNFQISGRLAHPELIRAYLRIKASAAVANSKCNVLKPDHAKLIVRACDQVLKMPEAQWPELFVVDPYQAGAGTSQNMNANEVVANVANRLAGHKLGAYAPIHPNDHVNRSQSTNDSFPTAMRLAILEASGPLELALSRLAASFEKKSRAWWKIPKSARTHLQDAVPMSLGQEFGAYGHTLRRCAAWVAGARDGLRELGIGGSAAGTGLTVPRGYGAAVVRELSRRTGEKLRLNPDLCEAMQSQSPVMYYSSTLRLTALELTRICNDLRLLVSGPMTGLSEILLPAVQPGSSIMPGKVNPSIVEMANQAWYSVLGYDHAVAQCVQAGQLELNVMMPMMAYSMLEATTVATRTLDTLREACVDGMEPNRARLQKYFEGTSQIATALSPKLGYERTAELVKEAVRREISVPDLVREQKLMPEPELRRLLDPDRVLFGK
jgi:aspartate ammonia-lyase